MCFHWCFFCLIPKTCPECDGETQRWFNRLSGFLCYSLVCCCCVGACAANLCCQQQHCQACYTENFEAKSSAIRRQKLFIDIHPEDDDGDDEDEGSSQKDEKIVMDKKIMPSVTRNSVESDSS
uniref:Uncharacterized protein n=1 Tax=Acrobeloides nanus TaxID=290746 RepID=A0A914E0H9_9BILA